MKRYVDADAIMEEMDRYIEHFTKLGMVVDGNECFYKVKELLTEAPAADVVEVVRCNDCKHKEHCHETVAHTRHHAGFIEHWSETIEWCSRGERKGGDAE